MFRQNYIEKLIKYVIIQGSSALVLLLSMANGNKIIFYRVIFSKKNIHL
jgi:hypothetical protein